MSGGVERMSGEEFRALDQLKGEMKDVLNEGHDDHFLLRWLRSRHFDVKKTEEMLRKHFKWYAQNDIDNILSWEPPEVLTKYYPGGIYGEDKEGRPNCFELSMRFDVKGAPYVVTHQDVVRYNIRTAEYCQKVLLPELSKKYGRRISNWNVITDVTGLSPKFMNKMVYDVWTDILQQLEANYPDTVHKIYIINAPKLFPMAYDVIKRFINPDTKKKIVMCGEDYKTVLLRDINATMLPSFWGGQATDLDGHPCCPSQICLGGEIPRYYYILDSLRISPDRSKFTRAVVGKGGSLQLGYQTDKSSFVLEWTFWSEKKGLDFSIRRKGSGESQLKDVVPVSRCISHIMPQKGSLSCRGPATYVIKFSKVYLFKPLEVFHHIRVLDDDQAQVSADLIDFHAIMD